MIKVLRKAKKALAYMLGAAVIVIAAIPTLSAYAVEITPGKYTVTVVPTYQNPDTGVIDDVGQNPGIGNVMVQAQVQTIGYVEIENDGTIWLNMRWNQADENIYAQFETSSDGSNTWTKRNFEVTNQTAVGNYEFMGNTFSASVTDYRFQLETLNDTIRCTNYVEAMGRDCIWFCYITDLKAGVSSEWNSVKAPDMTEYTESLSNATGTDYQVNVINDTNTSAASENQSAAPSEEETTTPEADTSQQINADDNKDKASEEVPTIKDREVAEAKTNDSSTNITSGKGLDDSTGIVGYKADSDKNKSSDKGFTTAQTIIFVIVGIAVGAAIVVGIFYIKNRRKKQYTDLFADVDDK